MFNLIHGGDKIGTSNLESGDPEARSASGNFFNVGASKALAAWILSIGGTEDDGTVYIIMNSDFELQNDEEQAVQYTQGTLIAVPDKDEAYIEVTGLTVQAYEANFSGHIAALADESP